MTDVKVIGLRLTSSIILRSESCRSIAKGFRRMTGRILLPGSRDLPAPIRPKTPLPLPWPGSGEQVFHSRISSLIQYALTHETALGRVSGYVWTGVRRDGSHRHQPDDERLHRPGGHRADLWTDCARDDLCF